MDISEEKKKKKNEKTTKFVGNTLRNKKKQKKTKKIKKSDEVARKIFLDLPCSRIIYVKYCIDRRPLVVGHPLSLSSSVLL